VKKKYQILVNDGPFIILKNLAFFRTFMKITQTRIFSRNISCFVIGLEVGIPGNSLNFTGLGSFLPDTGLTPLKFTGYRIDPLKFTGYRNGGPPHGPSRAVDVRFRIFEYTQLPLTVRGSVAYLLLQAGSSWLC